MLTRINMEDTSDFFNFLKRNRNFDKVRVFICSHIPKNKMCIPILLMSEGVESRIVDFLLRAVVGSNTHTNRWIESFGTKCPNQKSYLDV